MDNLYFEKPQINKTKVIICLVILFVLLGICLLLGFVFYKNRETITQFEDKTLLVDNQFNITFNASYQLEESAANNGFLLELHSPQDLNIYVDKIENASTRFFIYDYKSRFSIFF